MGVKRPQKTRRLKPTDPEAIFDPRRALAKSKLYQTQSKASNAHLEKAEVLYEGRGREHLMVYLNPSLAFGKEPRGIETPPTPMLTSIPIADSPDSPDSLLQEAIAKCGKDAVLAAIAALVKGEDSEE